MPRVLLAPDKFKGTLTAAQVAGHLTTGIHSVRPDVDVDVVPVSDGGDGLLDAARRCGFEVVALRAAGPTGRVEDTSYARRGVEAVVEMAEVCGLGRLPDGVLAPAVASSRGVGEVIAAALDSGCTTVLVGIGGSASTDGGAGMVAALGARVLDDSGDELADGGEALGDVATLDLAGLHPGLAEGTVTVACDVDNPLLGPTGAAEVYGPQKGADPDLVALLDRSLGRWADVVATATGSDRRHEPGAGAAGGVGFGAIAILGAELHPGAEGVGIGAAYALTDEASSPEESFESSGPLLERIGARIAAQDLKAAR